MLFRSRNVEFSDVLLNEIGRQRVQTWLAEASEVANRWFHLDDFGAEVTQHAGGVWSCKHTGEIEDANSLEWAHDC